MKKIIILLPNIKTGGGNRVFLELSNILVKKDYKVEVIYPNNSIDNHTFYVDNKIFFRRIGNFSNSKFIKLVNIIKIFIYIRKKEKDSIILVTDPIMAIFIFLLRGLSVYRFVQSDDYRLFDDLFSIKNRFLLNIYKTLTRISYNYNIKYMFNSKYTFEQYIKLTKNKYIKKIIIHPAINHSVFYNRNIRRSVGINIAIIARKHPMKGFITFIEAYRMIKSKVKINNVFVLSHDNLSQFPISDFKKIIPKDDKEIAYYYNKSHIFISTSWWEGFGLPPLEAMACGCAVILTDSGGVNEFAIHKKNCLIYKPRDSSMLANYIIKLIKDDNFRSRLSLPAIETAKNFTWEKSAIKLIRVIENHYD